MAPAGPTTPEHVLRRLEWRVLRRLDGRLQGDYRTLLQGAGIDVAELREYEPGDDVRHIDWNVTARTDIPHVRTYLEERELTAWLLLDRSASMGFGPVERPKEAVLTDVATAIARMLVRKGNRVGAILFDNTVERTIPPRTGRNHVLRITAELLRPAAHATNTATSLGALLDAAARTIKRRSLVIIVSDFISEPGWERPLGVLARANELVAIRLTDPRERDLPDAGLIVVEDAETGELLSIDTGDAVFRRRVREAAEAQDAEIAAAARRAQVDLHTVSTDDDLVHALIRIVEQRRRQWRPR